MLRNKKICSFVIYKKSIGYYVLPCRQLPCYKLYTQASDTRTYLQQEYTLPTLLETLYQCTYLIYRYCALLLHNCFRPTKKKHKNESSQRPKRSLSVVIIGRKRLRTGRIALPIEATFCSRRFKPSTRLGIYIAS